MQLKYVGDMPKVSQHGVTFDHSKADKYTYLSAAVELLEALSYGPTEITNHLYTAHKNEMNATNILDGLKKFCDDVEKVFQQREEKAKALVDELIQRVEDNKSLTSDERKAWLNNIDMMKDYYLQHVTNASAYECALDALADEIATAQIKEVKIPLFRNYGIVLHDLMAVLERRKSPIDSDMVAEITDDGLVGIFTFKHRV
jgi:ribosomal protein L33